MSLIRTIAIGLKLDARDFVSSAAAAGAHLQTLASLARSAQAAVTSLDLGKIRGAPAGGPTPGPAVSTAPTSSSSATSTSASPASTLEQSAGQAGEVASVMAASLTRGLLPLSGIGNLISEQLNRVGGTVTTLARRIDAAMKHTALDETLAKVQTALPNAFAQAGVRATRSLLNIRAYVTAIGDVAGKTLSQISGLDFRKAQSGAQGLGGAFRALPAPVHAATSAVKGLGLQIGIAFGLVGITYRAALAVKNFFATGIKGASDLNESISKTRFVFGGAADAIFNAADTAAKKFGVNRGLFIDSAVTLGRYGQQAGKTNAESAALGVTLTRLALDLASIDNLDTATAVDKVSSAVAGQAEVLRRNGAFLSAERVQEEAKRLGLARTRGELTEGAKIMARVSLIQKDLAKTSGDLERTAGGAANQYRNLTGTIKNTATTIGTFLLPAIEGVTQFLAAMAAGVGAFFERGKGPIGTFATYVAAGLANVRELASEIPQTLAVFKGEFDYVFGSAAARIGPFFEVAKNKVVDAIHQIGVVFRNLPEYAAIARLKLKEQLDTIPEYLRYTRQAATETASWLGGRFRYAGEVIASEVGYWVDHVRYFKDMTVAVLGGVWQLVAAGAAAASSAIASAFAPIRAMFAQASAAAQGPMVILTKYAQVWFAYLKTALAVTITIGAAVAAVAIQFEILATKTSIMVAQFVAFGAQIGVTIVGAVTTVVAWVFSALAKVVKFVIGNSLIFSSVFSAAFSAIGDFAISVLGGIYDSAVSIFSKITGLIGSMLSPVVEYVRGIFSFIGEFFGKTKADVEKWFSDITSKVQGITTRVKVEAPKAFTPPAPPQITSHQAEVDKLLERIKTLEAERLKPPPVPAAPAAAADTAKPAAVGGAKPSEYKATAAAQLGSSEAASAIARFRNTGQGGENKAAQDTAKNTRELVRHAKSTEQAMKEIQWRQQAQEMGVGAFPL